MTYLCLSVAAAGLGYLLGVRVGEKRERRRPPLMRRSAILPTGIQFDAKQNDRMWQAIQDRLAVDSLVGSATYRGDE
jgi:hypothetical protein